MSMLCHHRQTLDRDRAGQMEKMILSHSFQDFYSESSAPLFLLVVGQSITMMGASGTATGLTVVRSQRQTSHDHSGPPPSPKPHILVFLKTPIIVSVDEGQTFRIGSFWFFLAEGYFFINRNKIEHQEIPKSPYFWNLKLKPDLIFPLPPKKSFSLGTIWGLFFVFFFFLFLFSFLK